MWIGTLELLYLCLESIKTPLLPFYNTHHKSREGVGEFRLVFRAEVGCCSHRYTDSLFYSTIVWCTERFHTYRNLFFFNATSCI